MSKYVRDSDDVYAVKRLGDEIGYGHLMALAHELWARYLEEKGLPREGAHCAVGHSMVKEEYVEDAVTDPIYKVVVERALADTPQTDLVKESPSLVKDLANAFCEDGTWLERQGVYTLTLAEAKQRAVDIIEAVSRKDTADTPQTDVYDYKGNGKWERSE